MPGTPCTEPFAWFERRVSPAVPTPAPSDAANGGAADAVEVTAAKVGAAVGRAIAAPLSNLSDWCVSPLLMGKTLAVPGGSDILIATETLQRRQVDQKGIDALVAHELTHAFQEHHNPVPAWTENPVIIFGEEGVAVFHLVEGHAAWAHRTITAQLYGEPAIRIGERNATTLEKFRTAPIRLIMPKGDYDEGARFIQRVYEHGGTDLINRMWLEDDLLPTRKHVDNPDTWIQLASNLGNVD